VRAGLRAWQRRGLLIRMGARACRLGSLGLLLGLGVVLAIPHALRAEETGKSGKAGCVEYHGSAPYAGLGYDHIVTLKSACKVAMVCSVKTDVNPNATVVELAPGAETSVTTWRGSPAYAFTPYVTCSAAAKGGG
jgi:hypothetical protein